MRIEKKAIVDEIKSNLQSSAFVIMTDYSGMQVDQFDALRRRLSGHGARMQVVKNRLFRLAASDLKLVDDMPRVNGPLAMVTGGDGFEAARELKKFMQAHQKPALHGAVFEGRLLSAADVEELADLPARPVLYGMLAGVLAAPMSRLAGVMRQKVASLLYVLKAVEEKKGQS